MYPISSQGLSSPPRTAILYGTFQSTNFRQLHSHLLRLSSVPSPRVQYVFRPVPPDVIGEKGYLSGYGVTLDLKKMDYLALDDRRSHSKSTSQFCSPFRLFSRQRTLGPTSEDDQTVYADGPEADLDSVLQLLELYPLNTTLDVGEPLTSDEIARKPPGIFTKTVLTFSCKRLVSLLHSSSPSRRPRSRR
jgi:UDP-glucose:glycoprotein glucosyltransferase